jgi:AraC-like DNA-binding protein
MTSAAPGFGRLRFSTDDLPERERKEAWREMLGRAVMKLEIEPLPGSPYQAAMTLQALPELDLGTGVYSGMQFRRTPALVDSDDLVLVVTRAGSRTMRQHGREVTLRAGEAALVTCAEPGIAVSHSRERFFTVRLPFKAIAPAIGDLDSALVRCIPETSQPLRLLVAYADILLGSDLLGSPEIRELAARHIRDLAALALGATRDAASIAACRGLRAARLQAIKAHIASHLGERELTVNAVAAFQGVSPRYVQLLFEAEGTTFSQFLLRQRLARAHRMLTDRRYAERSITSIALDAGFGDLSTFDRAFRRADGGSPSDARAAARGESDS